MSVRQLYLKLFPTILLMWWGTVFSLFAARPQVVDIKPYNDGFVIASADGMLYWTDIEGVHLDSVNIKTDIAGIEVVEGSVLAVSPDCSIRSVERSGRNRLLFRGRSKIKNYLGRAVGIACTKDNTLILTDNGMILSTADYKSVSVFDFNSTYTAYYDEVQFRAICASENFCYIAGIYNTGMPAVFTSATGNVWSERTLNYTEGRENLQLEQQPLGLAYDSRMDRFVLACTDGYLFYMPGCSHCNSIERKSMVDITAVGFNSGRCICGF